MSLLVLITEPAIQRYTMSEAIDTISSSTQLDLDPLTHARSKLLPPVTASPHIVGPKLAVVVTEETLHGHPPTKNTTKISSTC